MPQVDKLWTQRNFIIRYSFPNSLEALEFVNFFIDGLNNKGFKIKRDLLLDFLTKI